MDNKIIKTINDYLSNEPIDKAWLFGSYSRGEETNDSDIDILVTFLPDSKMSLFRYAHIMNELHRRTGKNIDLVELGQLKDFAIESAEKEKILIYERKA